MPTTQSRCNSRGNQDAAAKWSRNPYFILPILSAVTLLLSMEITNKSMSQQQRWLMRILPFGVTFFTWTFPAGLFVYWITSNLVTMVQNYLIYNFGPGRSFSPGGSFMARLPPPGPMDLQGHLRTYQI